MQKPDILIYQDYVHNQGQLHAALVKTYGHARVCFCDAADILSGVLNDQVSLFVMPGGADLYYCEKLNGAGNDRIRAYVENGGFYLGLCAGAYYACGQLNWAAGTDQEISGSRELNFYSGIATGPILEYLENSKLERSWHHAAPIQYDDGEILLTTKTAYEGGPVFSGGDADILARYNNGDAAIIECAVGRGRAILSSSHIERHFPVAYQNRNASHAHDSAVMNELASHRPQQEILWNRILSRLVAVDKASHAA